MMETSTLHPVLADFLTSGLPSPRAEEWKYDTFLTELRRHGFGMATDGPASAPALPFEGPVNRIVLGGGAPRMEVAPEDAGFVQWLPAGEALPAFLRADREENPFIGLAHTTAPGRLHIHVPAGQRPTRPFVIRYAAHADGPVFLPAVISWQVDADAALTLWEVSSPMGAGPVWMVRLGYGTVAAGGRLVQGLLQSAEGLHYEIFHTHTELAARAHYAHDYFGWSDRRRSRHNLHVTFTGAEAEGHMNGLFLTEGKGVIDVHSRFTHAAPHCHSHEQYHGLLRDRAIGVFNGKIYVHAVAQQTDAYQSSRNVLLDGTPTMNAKPQLEIFADDVRCSHGCTVGPLDEASVFYLQARGIDPRRARTMLATAFGRQAIDRMAPAFGKVAMSIFEEKVEL